MIPPNPHNHIPRYWAGQDATSTRPDCAECECGSSVWVAPGSSWPTFTQLALTQHSAPSIQGLDCWPSLAHSVWFLPCPAQLSVLFITRTKREGLKAARSKSRYFIWFQDCDLSMIRLSLLTPETTSTYHTITTTLYNVTLLVIYVFIIMYMTSYVICHVIDVCQIGKKGIKCWILKHFYLDLT